MNINIYIYTMLYVILYSSITIKIIVKVCAPHVTMIWNILCRQYMKHAIEG